MKLKIQKRLAGQILKRSPNKIRFDPERLEEVKEAITKVDVRSLINDNAIRAKPVKGVSRVRARKIQRQKSKGKRRGVGSRKGKFRARLPKKEEWMNRIRLQREFLRTLKDKKIIDSLTYRMLYKKSGGGFFRSKRHIKLYIEERELVKK